MPADTPNPLGTPFVGREKELQRLHDWARHSWGSAVAVLGPRGVGKTALVRRFAAETRERNRPFVWLQASEIERVEDLWKKLKPQLKDYRQFKSLIVVLDDMGSFAGSEREGNRLREVLGRHRYDRRMGGGEDIFRGDLNWILVGERLPWMPRGKLPPEFYPRRLEEGLETEEEPWLYPGGIEMRVMHLGGLNERELAEMMAIHPLADATASTESRLGLAALIRSRFGGNPGMALILADEMKRTGDPLAALRALSTRENLSIAFNGEGLQVTATAELLPAQIHAPSGVWTLFPHLYLPKVGKQWQDAILEFQALVNRPRLRESQLQQFFEKHPHFLQGLDYSRLVARPVLERLDGKGNLIPDFFLQPADGHFADIWDLKLPSAPLIVGTKDRLRLSAAVSEALAQVREYRDYFDDPQNRQNVKDRYGLTSYRPNVAIVIGTNNLGLTPEKQKQIFESLPKEARVITYDQLLVKMRRHAAIHSK